MSSLLTYDKLHNIRDLGGMKTRDGSRIKSGRFIRCGYLPELSDNDVDKLAESVDTVIDFRTEMERKEKPDIEIPGIDYLHIPILNTGRAGVTREEGSAVDLFSGFLMNPDGAREYMCDIYRSFVNDPFSLSQYSSFVRVLLEKHDKAVLWHCTAGKDRTGIAAVIVEEILEVPREDIISDYMMSNRYLEADIRILTEFVKKKAGTDSEAADESLRYLFGADRSFIDAYYEEIRKKYGDFEHFLKEGIHLTEEEIKCFRNRYLEKKRFAEWIRRLFGRRK